MKNSLDLDALRGQWHALDRRLDATLEIDTDALRRALSLRVTSAFRYHSRWLLAALAFDAFAAIGLFFFAVIYWSELPYLLCAIALLLGLSVQAATDINEWFQLRKLDFDAPVIAVRERITELRRRRLRTTAMIMLLSVGLWTPFVLVGVRAVFGVDLYNALPWSVTAINVALGIAIIPLGYWISRRLTKRFAGSRGFDQFVNDAAGRTWNQASGQWNAYADLRDGVLPADVDAGTKRNSTHPAFIESMRALKRRQKLGIVVAVVPIIFLVIFNLSQEGGMWLLIGSGVVLHLVCVTAMIANIVHLSALNRLHLDAPNETIVATLDWMATQRERLARLFIVFSPLLALPTSLVATRCLFGINLSTVLPISMQFASVAIAICTTAALACAAKREPNRFTSAWVDWLCLGVRKRTNAVIHSLQPDHPDRD